MKTSSPQTAEIFLKLLKTMETLRGPNGCPWDKEQTPSDLNPHLLEEAYEVMEAVDSKNPERLKEELGDLLLQIVFHCQMAKEAGEFSIADVIEILIQKLVRRHPHVFGEVKVENVGEVLSNWEKIKIQEKKEKGDLSLLSGLPSHLPALLKAYRLGQKASRVGFDWPKVGDVLQKTQEELEELKEAVEKKDEQKAHEEFGDLLFSLANTARFLKINPEESLRHACKKFMERFQFIENRLKESQRDWRQVTLEELDRLWNESKGHL